MLIQASRFTSLGLSAVLGGLVAVSACDSGGDGARGDDGGSSNNAGSNNAGSNNAGSNNAGSSNAGSANGGTGGGTGQMPTACPGVVPPSTAITDFEGEPVAAGMFEWGSAEQGTMDFWGGTFNYPAALAPSFDGGAMSVSGEVTEYAGLGLYVQNCADASSFDGIRFTISGTPPAGEKVRFAVQTNTNEWATGVKGECLAPDAQKFINCVHPSVAIDVTEEPTTVEVTWDQLGMGKPAANATTDGSDVIGLQWILPWTETHMPYEMTLTIDDIELIGEGGGAGGSGAGGGANDPGMAGAAGGQ
jgi:hypothetical protein